MQNQELPMQMKDNWSRAICCQSKRCKIGIILGKSSISSSIGSLFCCLPHQRTFLSMFTWPKHSTTLMRLYQLLSFLIQSPPVAVATDPSVAQCYRSSMLCLLHELLSVPV